MKLLRFGLCLLMALLIFLMVCLPGLQDSRQMAKAWVHHHDSPNDTTRKELEDAQIANRKQMVKIELVLGSSLALTAIAFFRAGRSKRKPASQP